MECDRTRECRGPLFAVLEVGIEAPVLCSLIFADAAYLLCVFITEGTWNIEALDLTTCGHMFMSSLCLASLGPLSFLMLRC